MFGVTNRSSRLSRLCSSVVADRGLPITKTGFFGIFVFATARPKRSVSKVANSKLKRENTSSVQRRGAKVAKSISLRQAYNIFNNWGVVAPMRMLSLSVPTHGPSSSSITTGSFSTGTSQSSFTRCRKNRHLLPKPGVDILLGLESTTKTSADICSGLQSNKKTIVCSSTRDRQWRDKLCFKYCKSKYSAYRCIFSLV